MTSVLPTISFSTNLRLAGEKLGRLSGPFFSWHYVLCAVSIVLLLSRNLRLDRLISRIWPVHIWQQRAEGSALRPCCWACPSPSCWAPARTRHPSARTKKVSNVKSTVIKTTTTYNHPDDFINFKCKLPTMSTQVGIGKSEAMLHSINSLVPRAQKIKKIKINFYKETCLSGRSL